MADTNAATEMRRVVTGIDSEGKSVFVSDGPPPRSVTLQLRSGLKQTDLWHLASPPKSPADGGDLDHYSNLVPPPGGAHWRVVEFPPVTAAS